MNKLCVASAALAAVQPAGGDAPARSSAQPLTGGRLIYAPTVQPVALLGAWGGASAVTAQSR